MANAYAIPACGAAIGIRRADSRHAVGLGRIAAARQLGARRTHVVHAGSRRFAALEALANGPVLADTRAVP